MTYSHGSRLHWRCGVRYIGYLITQTAPKLVLLDYGGRGEPAPSFGCRENH